MKLHRLSVLALLSLGVVLGSLKAQSPSSAKTDPDLEAVKATAQQYIKAFEERDASALAKLFTEEGEFVDGSDNVVHGRKAIDAG